MKTKELDVRQVARLVDVHSETVRRWARDGLLPAHKLGQMWFVRIADLERFLGGVGDETK